MKVKYTGPSGTGVDLPLPDGRVIHVEHGKETPDLPADFAKPLLEQKSNWKPAVGAKPKAAAKPKKPTAKAEPPVVDVAAGWPGRVVDAGGHDDDGHALHSARS